MKGLVSKSAAIAAVFVFMFAAMPIAPASAQPVEIRQRRGLVFPRVTRTRAVPIRSAAPLAIQVPIHGAPLAITVPHGCGQIQAIQTPGGTLFLQR